MASTPAFTNIMRDPTRHYASPYDVARARDLTPDQKIQILQAWEFDSRQRQVASEENMPGPKRGDLHDVRVAMRSVTQARH